MKNFSHVKYLFLMLAVMLSSLFLMPSCSEDDGPDPDVIWDFAPVFANVYIRNEKGDNLLLPTVEGSLYGKNIVAEYKGEQYPLNWDSEVLSRYYLPTFRGLELGCGYKKTDDGYVKDLNTLKLELGEFDGGESQNISFTLRIEGYTDSWDVDMKYTFKWKKKEPYTTTTYYLNGKEVKDGKAPTIIL